jgi:hypothetical protein
MTYIPETNLLVGYTNALSESESPDLQEFVNGKLTFDLLSAIILVEDTQLNKPFSSFEAWLCEDSEGELFKGEDGHLQIQLAYNPHIISSLPKAEAVAHFIIEAVIADYLLTEREKRRRSGEEDCQISTIFHSSRVLKDASFLQAEYLREHKSEIRSKDLKLVLSWINQDKKDLN